MYMILEPKGSTNKQTHTHTKEPDSGLSPQSVPSNPHHENISTFDPF